jgi:hypothetical protein
MKAAFPFVAIFLWLGSLLPAQVPRQVVVEHFTNTRCGICAFRNPDFYDNLAAHPEVLNLAIHPSSPYASCVLSQHNPSQNDARTNYYGIYGGTPRLVVQGEVVSSGADYGSANIFNPYLNQSSPYELKVSEIRNNQDSVTVEVRLYRRGSDTLAQARLTVVYLEDTVFYAAPNGENEHYGVFRASLTDMSGELISLPALGDSVVLRYQVAQRSTWDTTRMQAMALLASPQSALLLQAAQTSQVRSSTPTSLTVAESTGFAFYPNPARRQIYLRQISAPVVLLDAQGRTVRRLSAAQPAQALDLRGLAAGLYWLRHGEQGYALHVH